ncbi:MAG: putative quinol monooxygenase [Acidimicrobiia bacterium]
MAKPTLIAKLTAADGKRDELIAACQSMIDHVTSSEPGTEVYVLHKDDKNENLLYFYEMYSDRDALGVHGKSERMAAFGKEIAPLLGGKMELTFLTPVGGKGVAL